MSETRNKRVRGLVRKLNRARRDQLKQIDILCNDMVSAHGDFVKQLRELTFSVKFYELALSQADLTSLLDTTVDMIKAQVHGSSVAVFLLRDNVFDIHMVDSDKPIDVEQADLESYFTPDVVRDISRSPHVCSLNDMCTAGLQASPTVLGSLSAAAVPIGRVGAPVGFILIYRSRENKLYRSEIETVTAITEGLCSAIQKWQRLKTADASK